MERFQLPPDRMAVLRVVHEHGESVCVGTCEHHEPGELRCHNVGYAAKVSSNGAKRRLRELADLGLLTKESVQRADGKVMARYTVSPEGLKLLGV